MKTQDTKPKPPGEGGHHPRRLANIQLALNEPVSRRLRNEIHRDDRLGWSPAGVRFPVGVRRNRTFGSWQDLAETGMAALDIR
jgi:hypothetical protein